MILKSKYFVKVLVLVSYFHNSLAVIYNLNDTEYKKLPPIFHVDPYEECMEHPEGLYCATELALVSDEDNPLMHVIQEYSARNLNHYNHSHLRYNLCITNTCKDFYENTTADLVENLEACLNKPFQDRYGLKTRVLDKVHCKKANEQTKVEVADMCMFALLAGILAFNIIGSLYDFICTNGEKDEGIRFLMYFAMRRNWRKLVMPTGTGPEPMLTRLKVVSGIKCMTTMLVISVHAIIPSIFFIDNTKYFEDLSKTIVIQALSNGTIVVQIFFIMSGFLLAYNLELRSEKDNLSVNWRLLPKGIVLRWIRVTPMYALVLFFIVTLNKHLINGPFWHVAVMREVEDCRQYWWQHLLYIHNYNKHSQCMLHTWYLASDTQLFYLGLVIYIVCRSPSSRKVVLTLLLVIALLIPVAHTYWQDLDGSMIPNPESCVNFFIGDKNFYVLHKLGHTNMFGYLVGMSMAFLAYHGQKINYDVQKLRKYRILYYAIVPAGLAVLLSGRVFYREEGRPPMPVRLFFAAYQKPVWCLLLGILTLGAIFKYENILRGLGEWRGWSTLSRLSYCAYLVHITIIRLFMGLDQSMKHTTFLSMTEDVVLAVVASYLVAFPCWMLVEQPLGQLLKLFLPSAPEKEPAGAAIETNEANVDPKSGDKKIVFVEPVTRV